MLIENVVVLENVQLADGLHKMTLEGPIIAHSALPGQFVNIEIDPGNTPLFRRPMSVAFVSDNRFGLIFKVFGEGTLAMSRWQPGHKTTMLGPLGNGWMIEEDKPAILIGGGVGIAPVSFLGDHLKSIGHAHTLIMGARHAGEHYLKHDPGQQIFLTTDDGSAGVEGTVINGLMACQSEWNGTQAVLYCCGPEPMLAAVKRFAAEHGLRCQLAVEALMACGFGICQGCNVETSKVANSTKASYRSKYKLTCLDGPVFWADELK